MFHKKFVLGLILIFIVSPVVFGQNLDGGSFNPDEDPDIDMFMASWKESMPRHINGSLIVRDILIRGDQLNPPRKGAVLEYVNYFSHTTLDIGNSTVPSTLKGEQQAYYVISGNGIIHAGGRTDELFEGICFLVPENLEFTMTNTGNEPLTMYLVCEPVPDGFTPRRDIYVASEAQTPFNTVVGHWSYQEKDLLLSHHGFATLHAVITLTLDPMTIGHPHFHVKGAEEVWTTISGNNVAWLGKEIREQPPGTAYMIPPDGKTNHSNINESKTGQVKMLYFSVRRDIRR